ncbi:hypothetical protein [Brevibacillus sp. SIMBA_040]
MFVKTLYTGVTREEHWSVIPQASVNSELKAKQIERALQYS